MVLLILNSMSKIIANVCINIVKRERVVFIWSHNHHARWFVYLDVFGII
jgi:hypothetical protein